MLLKTKASGPFLIGGKQGVGVLGADRYFRGIPEFAVSWQHCKAKRCPTFYDRAPRKSPARWGLRVSG